MPEFEHRTALPLVVLTFALALAGCDGLVKVTGVVRNSRGEPVAGAKVHVTDMDEFWRTESRGDGCFDVSGTTDPMHSSEPLTVVAPNYKTASAKVRTAGTHNEVVVTLVSSDSATASRIELLASADSKILAPCHDLK